MTTLTSKHDRLAALRPLSPESVASLAAAWDVRMVHESNALEAADSGDFQTWQTFLSDQLEHELDEWLTALKPSSSSAH